MIPFQLFGNNPGRKRLEEVHPSVMPIQSLDDYLVLEDLKCYSSTGVITESYPRLLVRKDVSRDDQGSIRNFTSFGGIAYQESKGLFVPSFALTCAIVKRLFEQKSNEDCLKVLMQYKDKGNGTGWHGQNTLIGYRQNNDGQIIHYPQASDYPSDKSSEEINSSHPRISLPFNSKGFSDCLLAEALKKTTFADYIKNLTGLQDPEFLIELGKYFDKPTRVWTWWNRDRVSGAWFGCGNYSLILDGDDGLGYNLASRGVRLGAQNFRGETR